MISVDLEPIPRNWTIRHQQVGSGGHENRATPLPARDLNAALAQFEISDLGSQEAPLLAAAAAELVAELDLRWPMTGDDSPVVLVRIIAKIASKRPDAGGRHVDHLLDHLMNRLRAA